MILLILPALHPELLLPVVMLLMPLASGTVDILRFDGQEVMHQATTMSHLAKCQVKFMTQGVQQCQKIVIRIVCSLLATLMACLQAGHSSNHSILMLLQFLKCCGQHRFNSHMNQQMAKRQLNFMMQGVQQHEEVMVGEESAC